MDISKVLQDVNFGQRIAEEDNELEAYFVETNQWRRLVKGEIDIIYGPKGAGKSAFYFLLLKKREEMRRRGTILIAGENPRGATAFQDLATDPPASELEFSGIWKLYIAALVGMKVRELKIEGQNAASLVSILTDAGLLKSHGLDATLRAVRKCVRAILTSGVESEVALDPITGIPVTVTGRLTLRDLDESGTGNLSVSLDSLLQFANDALVDAQLSLWVLLDRLDIAFADSKSLEENALRALFKVYLDLRKLQQIELKIFLRNDIWNRITQSGFREASHITKHITINWDTRSLLNLIVKRAVRNKAIQEYYSCTPDGVLASHKDQDAFFYRMFPEQVEKGSRRPTTLDWLLTRTADGTKYTAPREVIHLLNCSIQTQLEVLEIGGYEPDDSNLVAGYAFKESLPEVSKVRLEQTLYAEYPTLKPYIEKLRGEKTSHSVATLSIVWSTARDLAQSTANELVAVGFFEQRGERHDPEFWVPFLYRDALGMVQGSAD